MVLDRNRKEYSAFKPRIVSRQQTMSITILIEKVNLFNVTAFCHVGKETFRTPVFLDWSASGLCKAR